MDVNTKAIERNRKAAEESLLDSPFCADMSDTDASWPTDILSLDPGNRAGIVPRSGNPGIRGNHARRREE